MNYQRKTYNLLIISLLSFFCNSCGIYSFSGINTTATSIFVGNFQNRAGGGPPTLNIDFTERLKEYYQRNSRLTIADGEKEGELVVLGTITQYQMTPIAATGNDIAAQNRLTIAVEVEFVNKVVEKKDFKQAFSFYADFPQNQTLTQVESQLIENIFDQLVLDIFNKTVADW
jgi:hypothetical protein